MWSFARGPAAQVPSIGLLGWITEYLFRVKPPHASIAIVAKPLAKPCVPKRDPIVLASFMIGPHYTNVISDENDKNHEVIHRIEKSGEFERQQLPFLKSVADFDIVIGIGFGRGRGNH